MHGEQRLQRTPPTIGYTRIKLGWVPHRMYNYEPNFHSDACNTDEHGFRYTYKNGQPLSVATCTERDGPKAVRCGGSSAFGTGARSDRRRECRPGHQTDQSEDAQSTLTDPVHVLSTLLRPVRVSTRPVLSSLCGTILWLCGSLPK